MKVLYTGAAGQLGYDVVAEMRRRNIDCLGVDRNDFDITDSNATQKFIVAYHPDVVLHCAGYTAVDAAEDDVDLCRKINVIEVQIGNPLIEEDVERFERKCEWQIFF